MANTSGFAHPQDNEFVTVKVMPELNGGQFVLSITAGNWQQTVFVPTKQVVGLVKSLQQAVFDLLMNPDFAQVILKEHQQTEEN